MNVFSKPTRWIILAVLAILLAATIVSDRWTRAPSGSTPLPTVTIGLVTFPGYAPLYVAKEKDLFPGFERRVVGDV